MSSQLEDEIDSWEGFPRTLRKEDRELWEEMVQEVRQCHAEAVEKSGMPLTTDPFFMALILAQQRTIERLRTELRESEGLKSVDAGTGQRVTLFASRLRTH
jgi:(p)ppGpp synthase/HD superfamily hydrolase